MTMFGSSIDFLTKHAKDLSASGNRSISRITSGGDALKLAAMEKKSGTLGKVIRITVDNLSKRDSIRFFQNAISFMKFQEEAITYADKLYSEMQILAERAATSTTSLERQLLNEQFVKLRDKATALNELTFNGKALFDELAGSVDYTIDFSSGLFRDNSGAWDKDDLTWGNTKDGFASFATTKDVVYNKGILVLDVNTGGAGEQFVFGYADESMIGKDNPINFVPREYRHKNWQNKGDNITYSAGPNELEHTDGFIYSKLTDAPESGQAHDDSGYLHQQKTGTTAGVGEVAVDGLIFKQATDENGDFVFDDDGEKVSSVIPVADLTQPIVKINEDGSLQNSPVYDDQRKHPPNNPAFGLVEIDEGSHLSGINPIFDSSKNADFNEFNGTRDWGINTWDTDGAANTSDFDRFFIEWGPDQETSFRFIPLSEGMNGSGYVSQGASTTDDGTFDNKTRYLQNLGMNNSGTLWGLDAYEDSSFQEEYGFLDDQLYKVLKDVTDPSQGYILNDPGDPNSGDRLFHKNEISDAQKSAMAIFDSSHRATRKIYSNSQDGSIFEAYNKGDAKVYNSDPSNTIMQLRVNSKTIYQVRAQYFKPKVEDTDVGNIGDFNTYMKPLGLGKLRDSLDESGVYAKLSIDSETNANTAINALKLEKEGLLEQMGILSNNLNRVMSSMDAVNKQLGIQEDIIDPAPDQVLLDELKNLTRTREMRAINASLMNKVVQINHDMVNLLLT